jgi:mannose-6-phosphate isomerase-like protein (cupin superfamily)
MRFRTLVTIGIAGYLVTSSIAAFRWSSAVAQDVPDSELLLQATLATGEYPVAPAFVRLLRITLEPEASSPLHTHPGPEVALIERGTATVQIGGRATVSTPGETVQEGTPTAGSEAPVNSEFELGEGDQITYMPQTSMTFRNGGSDPLSMLTVVMLPAGHQHPPGITYVNGQPDASAFTGVTPEILGDGIATMLPVGGASITVERFQLDPGEAIPSSESPVMLSLERGVLDFTVVGGKVQVSRSASPGPQADSAPGTEVSMAKEDAIFFPLGMKEVQRDDSDGELVLLRMTIDPTDPSQQPTPTEEGVGEIQIAEVEGTPSAEAAETAEAEPTATATPDTGLGVGDKVQVNSEGVNLRAGPGTDFEVVTQLFTGQVLTITGDSEEAEGYVWWPVELDEDPSVTGYIADEFFDPLE